MHEKKLCPVIAAANAGAGSAEGVSFDGVNDYLSRNSDLAGNANGKKFTFSCWVYSNESQENYIYNNGFFLVRQQWFADGNVVFSGEVRSTTGSYLIRFQTPQYSLPLHVWNHFLVSIDVASASTRKIFINDNDVTSSTNWISYANNTLQLSGYAPFVASNGGSHWSGRLAHVFLDYAYRNLSTEANRRLFITDDLKPADGLASLSPILYLPMRTAETAHINEGTGGDFTPNGVLDTAQCGPNQWNCVASTMLDSPAQYIRGTVSVTSSKEFTLSFVCKRLISNVTAYPFTLYASAIQYIKAEINNSQFTLIAYVNSTPYNIVVANLSAMGGPGTGKNWSIQVSVNTTTQTAEFFVNGRQITAGVQPIPLDLVWTFSNMTTLRVNEIYTGSSRGEGEYGELYFSADYTALSEENPFWDSNANKPKPVRQVLEETGGAPVIALPISADNPGKNYGTGGDFTVYGGGLKGARGMSEYISRSVIISGGANNLYLNRSANPTAKISFVFATNGSSIRMIWWKASNVNCSIDSSNKLRVQLSTSTGENGFRTAQSIASGEWQLVFVSIDTTTNTKQVYMNDQLITAFDPVATSYNANGTVSFSGIYLSDPSYSNHDNAFAALYFAEDFIDLSQEENRNLIADQLSYPKDLSPAIESGEIPRPIFYLKFEDPDDPGLDSSGNNNHFTVNGTVTPGADFHV